MIDPPRSLNVRQLQALMVLSRELHFERAATRLQMSQPALSRLVGRVEEIVGARLFQRRPVVALTEAGEAVIPEIAQALAGIGRALDRVKDRTAGERGRILIEASSSALVSPFAALVARFRERHPGIVIHIRTRDTADQISADSPGSVDFSVIRHVEGDLGPESHCVCVEPFIVALPDAHPLTSRDAIALPELRDDTLIEFRREVAPRLYDALRGAVLQAGLRPETWLAVGDWLSALGLVSAGTGVALVPESFRRLAWGGVSYRPLVDPLPNSAVIAIQRSSRLTPATRRFRDLLGLRAVEGKDRTPVHPDPRGRRRPRSLRRR